jgi:protein TonB
MASTSYTSSSDSRESIRRRTIALSLTVVVHLLLLLMLLTLAGPQIFKKQDRDLNTFTVLPDQPAQKASGKVTKEKKKSGGGAPPQPSPSPAPAATKPPPPFNFVTVSKDVFASADISKLPAHKQGEGEGTGTGKDSGAAYGPGEGPGGEQLFNAEWYREPPPGALALYLPGGAPANSWGEIACKTIENYHVENCRQLGESPVGSGISRAMRQAAWQFLVRPPRVGGKAIMGAWVRIHWEFTARGKSDDGDTPLPD